MELKKATGRPRKVTYKTMLCLADALKHNSSISEACRWAGISRTTYFSYMKNEVFAEKMQVAKEKQNEAVHCFFTLS